MTTITRENAEIKSFVTGFLSDPAHDNQSSDSLLANVFRIALASLEAEPVAWECGENIILFNPDTVEAYAKRAEISPKPLFSAPPALVVPEFETWFNSQESGRSICSTQIRRSLQEISWNACCAAMLQGKDDGILTNEDTKGDVQVRELTMLIKQLVSQLRKAKPDCKLPEKAMVYLKRNGLISAEDILR
ncbi:TPA: hypothetical protein KL329_002910 [Escherichia coli]|uniref:DUF551 domain-containing protein n=1 Tax=Escherichia coli TaxID=562 RepID=A0AAF0HPD4_ECOLX|nr:hypothetical protein [Escherichia coli]EFE8029685.1 hypothetical protein [Escherichia coli]MDM4859660.1 hypothetical protein [Escherichia coli]MDM4860059.1 hypothetical protein [Escherichia coli]MDM4864279.1 hypothetical protein [Escherichia coli]MED8720186.1 hypothetical protein [Escherichia coli]